MAEQALIVVSKDELVLNLLKKLVETNDDLDNGEIVGTEDGSVSIISWNEKLWLDNKKAGTIENKVLFIGKIKGVDKLEPLIDVKYNKWGIKYGWAGKQALIQVNEYAMEKEEYQEFIEEFRKRMLPEKEGIKLSELVPLNENTNPLVDLIAFCGAHIVDFFTNKKKLRQQLFLYGILNLYENDLETFMKM